MYSLCFFQERLLLINKQKFCLIYNTCLFIFVCNLYVRGASTFISKLNKTSFYVEIKCHLGATEVFIADLIPCSTCFGHHYAHHQELKSIIQWLLPVVFRTVVFQVAGLVWS